MKQFFDILENLFFTNFIGEINLYTILASIMKFVFVIIVLWFVFRIVKMISADIRTNLVRNGAVPKVPRLRLLSSVNEFDFPIREEYFLADRTTIGRAEDNTVVLKDRRVSKHHAQIVLLSGEYRMEDLGATNPTTVNGRAITEPVVLQHGDRISLGDIFFVFLDGGINEN